jgi:transposase
VLTSPDASRQVVALTLRKIQSAQLGRIHPALTEAHEHAFAYFGGVFHRLRYDNLASAVRKILRG